MLQKIIFLTACIVNLTGNACYSMLQKTRNQGNIKVNMCKISKILRFLGCWDWDFYGFLLN